MEAAGSAKGGTWGFRGQRPWNCRSFGKRFFPNQGRQLNLTPNPEFEYLRKGVSPHPRAPFASDQISWPKLYHLALEHGVSHSRPIEANFSPTRYASASKPSTALSRLTTSASPPNCSESFERPKSETLPSSPTKVRCCHKCFTAPPPTATPSTLIL